MQPFFMRIEVLNHLCLLTKPRRIWHISGRLCGVLLFCDYDLCHFDLWHF